MTDLTIILPCAGEGKRMGLDSPKELYRTGGQRLIDFSLAHIEAYNRVSGGSLKIAVVIRPGKEEVAAYVTAQLPGIRVERVWFDPSYEEWPGSVYSANTLFSPRNLVLLPDSFLSLSKLPDARPVTVYPHGENRGRTLIAAASHVLERRPVMFGWVPCQKPQVLSSMGAVAVENSEVIAFQDKPREELHRFNGFWTCYGFTSQYGAVLYDFLIASLRHRSPRLERQTFYPPAALRVGRYYDLGTPERIAAFSSSISSR